MYLSFIFYLSWSQRRYCPSSVKLSWMLTMPTETVLVWRDCGSFNKWIIQRVNLTYHCILKEKYPSRNWLKYCQSNRTFCFSFSKRIFWNRRSILWKLVLSMFGYWFKYDVKEITLLKWKGLGRIRRGQIRLHWDKRIETIHLKTVQKQRRNG